MSSITCSCSARQVNRRVLHWRVPGSPGSNKRSCHASSYHLPCLSSTSAFDGSQQIAWGDEGNSESLGQTFCSNSSEHEGFMIMSFFPCNVKKGTFMSTCVMSSKSDVSQDTFILCMLA